MSIKSQVQKTVPVTVDYKRIQHHDRTCCSPIGVSDNTKSIALNKRGQLRTLKTRESCAGNCVVPPKNNTIHPRMCTVGVGDEVDEDTRAGRLTR